MTTAARNAAVRDATATAIFNRFVLRCQWRASELGSLPTGPVPNPCTREAALAAIDAEIKAVEAAAVASGLGPVETRSVVEDQRVLQLNDLARIVEQVLAEAL